ncbi:MAG: ATPase, T2SS/T4P/T4SS family, partial [Bacilli bacterium]
ETAHIAVKAAITGHLVLSTIHTNDAVSTISRLLDMGVEKYLVADSLIGIISERLVRKLCPSCKVEYKLDELEARRLGVEKGFVTYKPKGCPNCNFTGLAGRAGVFEILEINQHIRDVIDSKDISTENIRRACEETKYVTLDKAAAKLVKDGLISYGEYASLLNYDTEDNEIKL